MDTLIKTGLVVVGCLCTLAAADRRGMTQQPPGGDPWQGFGGATAPPRIGPPNLQPPHRQPGQRPMGPPRQAHEGNVELFLPSKILARVGDQTIFWGDLIGDVNQLIESQIPTAPEEVKKQQREKLVRQLLTKAVEQKLLYVDAVRQLPQPEKLPEILENIKGQFDELAAPDLMRRAKVNSVAELDAKLRQFGTSLRQARQAWAESQLIGIVVRQQVQPGEITHQEMLDEYHEHLADYQVPAKVKWEQLMVRFDKFPNRLAAKAEIANMGNKVIHGASLPAIAQERSNGFRASEGGQHDWTSQGSLVHKELDEALFLIDLHRLSDIIETKAGFHIVRVLDRKPASRVSFLDAQVKIKERLEQKKQQEQVAKYVSRLKEEIPVWTIYDESPETASGGTTRRR